MTHHDKQTLAITDRLKEKIGKALKDLEFWEGVIWSSNSTPVQVEQARGKVREAEARLQEATRTLALVESASSLADIAGAMIDDGVKTYPAKRV